jgi:hypothetical protein
LEKIEFGFAQLEGFATPLDQIIPQYDRAIAMWSHLLGMDQALGPGRSPIAWQMGLPANPWEQGQELVRTGATIDLAKANAQLDREFRATSIQTVIQKLGEQLGLTIEQLLTPGLLSEQFARGMQPDIFTSDSGTPHVFQGAGPNAVAYFADIAAFADRLESAGFQPGEVGASIEKFLQSVDENVVNNPAWAHIHDLLSGAAFQSVDPNEVAGAISDLLAPLPTAIYDRVRGQAVALQDEMTTLLSGADATAEHVKARVERIKQELEAWSTITQLYTQLNAEIAALSGSLVRQTAAAIEAWRVQVKSFDDGITDLKESLELASGAGNAVALAQSAQALYEAEAQRYKATLEMVQQIQSTVLGAEKSIADLAGTFALIDLKAGDGTAFNRLLAGLNDLALTAGSAAERLFAVTTAVSNIAAAAPILAEQAGAAGDPSTYFRAIVTAATPALQVMNDLIAGASPGAERLGFLQQQAAMITQLGQAAVASVEAWAAAAIKAEQDRAQEEIDAVRAAAEARKAALQGEAAMVQEQIAATQKALAIAQAWESSLQSSQQFVLGLKLGEGSPLSQAQKLGLVRGNYQAALAAYMATPTAEGLSGLQGFAQQYLQVAGNTPALIAKIIADIEKAQALAPRGQVQVLEAQLEAQQLTLKSINDEITKIDETSAAQIKAIEEARDQNIASITARAKEIIDGINAQVTQALRDNADAQIAEQAKVLAEAKKLRDEVTGGLGVDSYLATEAKKHTELLRQIRDALSGVPQHQTGTWHAKRGLAFLHEGEIVATDPVDLVRRAARFVSAIAPVPVRADAGTRQTINVTLNYNGSGTADDAKRMVAVVVDELNRRARSGNGPLKGGVVRGVVKR